MCDPNESSSQNARCSILLAEDNYVNQRVVINFLENENYDLYIVGNGLEAFEKIQERKFDIILMDVVMPVMVCFTVLDYLWVPRLDIYLTTLMLISNPIIGWVRGNGQDSPMATRE